MKKQIFLKALVASLLVFVITCCLTIYFYKDEKDNCNDVYKKISQEITVDKNVDYYCSTWELIKGDLNKETKIKKLSESLDNEKEKNTQEFNNLKVNIQTAKVFSAEPTSYETVRKNILKEPKIDIQNKKLYLVNQELVADNLPKLQALYKRRLTIIEIKKDYHSVENLSSFWKNFMQKAEGLDKINEVNITPKDADNINFLWGSWYSILKSELSSLGIIQLDKFNESLPYKFYSDDDFIRTVGSIDFTKIDPDLQKYGVFDTEYKILDGGVGDEAIRKVAKERGFLVHTLADKSKLKEIEGGYYLQKDAAIAYEKMKEAAKKDGVEFTISSGFRDFNDQNKIFISRLQVECMKVLSRECVDDDFKNGQNEQILNELLKVTAPPGFSRHHSAHAVDLNDMRNTKVAFAETPSYKWLSDNNFLNAKRFGFLPSYPAIKDGFNYGPEPESWEYVYVGDKMTKSDIFLDGAVGLDEVKR